MLPDLHDPTYTRSVEELNPEIESGMAGARGWGRRMGSKGLLGTEIQFGKMEKFWEASLVAQW